MKLPRLLETSAARLALRYVLAYAAILGLAWAALWASTRWLADTDAERALEEEFRSLTAAPDALREALALRLPQALEQQRFYLLTGLDQHRLAGNMRVWPPEPEIPLDGKVHRLWIDEDAFPAGLYIDEPYLPIIATQLADGRRLLLARGAEQAGPLREWTLYLLEVLSAAALLSLILGVAMGRAILRRMDAVGRTADEIMRGDLAQRVPVSARGDEFDALAVRLNAMLERIQQLLRGMRDVSDNVAHDLRRPLTRLRNRMEVSLLEPRAAEEYRQVLMQGVEDTDSLIKTFNSLLAIAQAEAGHRRSDWVTVNLHDLALDMAELYGPAAEEKDLRFEVELASAVNVSGSRHLLAQAIGNLLENAIKYTPAPGRVCLSVRVAQGAAEVMVSDTGPGVPAVQRAHVLERFVRLDASRQSQGNGLGLSLVKAAAIAHGAQLLLEDNAPGLRVRLRFAPRSA